VIPVGLGRSYGDSALNSGGIQLSSLNLHALEIDPITGIAKCGSGVSIRELEHMALKQGFFPPVVPGTAFVTIGGAIASDVHGKSQHKKGNFSNHVLSFDIVDSLGNVTTILPKTKEFEATVGGMGLTGFIISASIQLEKVQTGYIVAREVKVTNLKEMLDTMKSLDDQYSYIVAWIDLSGNYEGRGIVSAGRHATSVELPEKSKYQKMNRRFDLRINYPKWVGVNVINRLSVRIFNEIWYRKSSVSKFVSIDRYMHPLDGIGNWNYLYGKRGFIQYQFVVPDGHEDYLKHVLSVLKSENVHSFLAVLKKFGSKSIGLLSFPIPGWTLTIDICLKDPKHSILLETLDSEIASIGGRVYLTKDSRMDKVTFARMYPNMDKWKEVKKEMDPQGLWQSDQGRRLGIC
jgi:decaprenylphospho-beta-D-ribofuranose 2-oxidase